MTLLFLFSVGNKHLVKRRHWVNTVFVQTIVFGFWYNKRAHFTSVYFKTIYLFVNSKFEFHIKLNYCTNNKSTNQITYLKITDLFFSRNALEFHSGHIVRDDTVIFSGVPFVILYFCNSPHSTPLTLNGHPLDDPHWPRGAPPRLVFLHPGLFSVLAEHAWILNFRSNKRKQSAFAKMVGPY